MKSGLFSLPKYVGALKMLNIFPSRNLGEEIIRDWDKDLCRKMFITAIFIGAGKKSNLKI